LQGQKLYLKFEDENGNEHYFLATKRGNIKHLRKTKLKIEQIKELLKNPRITRDYSDIIFDTLTLDRSKFMDPIDAWLYLTNIVNDYLENLKKKLRKTGNDIIFFLKTYELHEDLFPHVHLIIRTKKPLKTFLWKSKKTGRIESRFKKKRQLLEWNYGFVDAKAPRNANEVIAYMIKYCIKNYFEIENEQDKKKKSKKKYPEQEQKSNKNHLLTILWLFRKFTISHSRLSRLDTIESELTYSKKTYKFKGIIIINYTILFEQFIMKNYKLKEIETIEIDKTNNIIKINGDIISGKYEICEDHIIKNEKI